MFPTKSGCWLLDRKLCHPTSKDKSVDQLPAAYLLFTQEQNNKPSLSLSAISHIIENWSLDTIYQL